MELMDKQLRRDFKLILARILYQIVSRQPITRPVKSISLETRISEQGVRFSVYEWVSMTKDRPQLISCPTREAPPEMAPPGTAHLGRA